MAADLLGALTMALAGLLVTLSPCLFPVLPAYLMYLARRYGSALRITVAFTLAMSASLVAYAVAATTAGAALVAWLGLSPSRSAAILATVFLTLSVAQLTPAKVILSFPKLSPRVKRLDAVGAAALGAFFAVLAAPCASGPLLAFTAKMLLEPESAIPYVLSFTLGASVPFVLIGLGARKLGEGIHRSISRSWLVKNSDKLSSALLASYAVVSLWSAGDPLPYVRWQIPTLESFLSYAWTALSLLMGAVILASLALKTRLLFVMALLPLAAGTAGAIAHLKALDYPLSTLRIAAYTLSSLAWLVAYLRGGGRLTKWVFVSFTAALAGDPLVHELAEATLAGVVISSSRGSSLAQVLIYSLCVYSLGLSLTPLAMWSLLSGLRAWRSCAHQAH